MLLNRDKSFRILIVDDIHPVFVEILQAAGFFVDYQPFFTYEETLLCIADYHVLVLRSKFKVNADLIDLATNLKVIARAGAGVDNIDVEYADHKNIKLISANEGNCDAVAEHMLGMLLSLLHNLRISDDEIRKGIWKREENRGTELSGKTVGLIGYGNNGQAMARKLSGFGVKVLAYDKYRGDYSDAFAQEATMVKIFEEVDILSLHIPLTKETKGLINGLYISKFRKPFYLLNGSRGGIVDMDAIVQALAQGRVLGGAFDVLPIESFPALASTSWFNELKEYSNVILSPHVAGWTVESYFKIGEILAKKLVKLL